MSIEKTTLYKELKKRVQKVPAGPNGLMNEFDKLREIIQEHSKYIVLIFPEYTPHDYSRHLDNMFSIADRVLGTSLYKGLSPVELLLLAFGLYGHDWGMAVSEAEKKSLLTNVDKENFALLPDEPVKAQRFLADAKLDGVADEVAWRDYVRIMHGFRSGARLRKHLTPLGSVFADAVAKIAEGHTVSLREIRDPDRYPLALPVFGETVNIAALAAYVRIIDLLDVAEDRTPYALWTFAAPTNLISSIEWKKHRALSPVAVRKGSALREILITGRTDDYAVFAALADLSSWIDEQFAGSIAQLRTIGGKYDIDIDSRITWKIDPVGFEPLSVRFEPDRREILGLLSNELYQDDTHVFIRELLQNSVDAIDMREAMLIKQGLTFKGEIRIRLTSDTSSLSIEWRDNGIGMDEDVLASYFARPGQCWYRSREANRIANIDAVSRFGIGVLSFFTVSDTLTVETQRDPQVGKPHPGLIVEIPTRDSHFRIRTATGLPVGTMLRLKIPSRLTAAISKESICAALGQIARYVRHRIVVECDGVPIEILTLAKSDNTNEDVSLKNDYELKIIEMKGDSDINLEDTTSTITFEIGSINGDYHGHYSAIVPKRPAEVRKNAFDTWFLGDLTFNRYETLTNNEEALFVKGIRTGRVTQGKHLEMWSNLHTARGTSWIGPNFLLNVRHPSYIDFNLARSSAQIKSNDLIIAAWLEIAAKLHTSTFNWPIKNCFDLALLIGSCALFGAVPNYGLDALVKTNECPLLVFKNGKSLQWISLQEFANKKELIEGPFELALSEQWRRGTIEIGRSSVLEGWEGDDFLFPLNDSSSDRYPWVSYVLDFNNRALSQSGWVPTAICPVQQTKKDTAQLVCRVWRKSDSINTYVDKGPSEKLKTGTIWNYLKSLYNNAPEVLQFSRSTAQYAAFGSRYWNIDHPKIIEILTVFNKLIELKIASQLSADSSLMMNYLTSYKSVGFKTSSRHSNAELAINVPNRLLDFAEKQGLPSVDHLVLEDFVPGTIGKYEDPDDYDISEWEKCGYGLGHRLD